MSTLVLARKLDQTVLIDGGRIKVRVVSLDRGQCRLAFEAPEEVVIMREELLPPDTTATVAAVLESQPTDWQLRLRVGDRVSVRRDDGLDRPHTVKATPWRVCGRWVIGLSDISGGYLLSRVVRKMDQPAI